MPAAVHGAEPGRLRAALPVRARLPGVRAAARAPRLLRLPAGARSCAFTLTLGFRAKPVGMHRCAVMRSSFRRVRAPVIALKTHPVCAAMHHGQRCSVSASSSPWHVGLHVRRGSWISRSRDDT